MRTWLLGQARAGNDRVLRLLGAIRRVWELLLPDPIRIPVERLGRRLQLDERLAPAVLSPFIYAAAFRLGTWWLLVAVPVVLWGHAVAGRRLSIHRQLIGVGVFFILILVLPPILAGSVPATWAGVGEISGLTFTIGLYGLLFAGLTLALVVTLGWALLSPTVAALVGGALGVLVAVTAYVGLLPGAGVVDLPAEWLGVGDWNGVALDLAVFALVGGAFFLLARRWEAPVRLRRLLLRLVPTAAVTAWLLPAVFAYSALMAIPERLQAESYTVRGFEQGLLPRAQPASLTSEQLMRAYRPLLLLHRDERWLAGSVGPYVREATVWSVRPDGALDAPIALPRGTLPYRCARTARERENPAPAPLCFALVGQCAKVARSCDRGRRTPWPEQVIQRGRVYARVVVRGTPQSDTSPPIFREPLPYPNLYAVIQYWIFYRNNFWEAQTGVGRIVQRHQSDWEQITVGVSRTAPLFVAYSSHCGGQWLEWGDARTRRMPDGSVRPVVWVARGSHANYPDPAPRQPDFLSCRRSAPGGSERRDAQLASWAIFALPLYGANVRESLPGSFVIQDPRAELIDARTQPFSFPGRWAAQGELALINPFRETTLPPPKERVRAGADNPVRASGPDTPACKAVWKDPLAVIFCGLYWHPDEKCTVDLDRRRQQIAGGCI